MTMRPQTGYDRQNVFAPKTMGGARLPSTVAAVRAPVAPPAYRPQPTPKVLQTKAAPASLPTSNAHLNRHTAPPHSGRSLPATSQKGMPTSNSATARAGATFARPTAPPVYRPQPAPKVLQSKTTPPQSARAGGIAQPLRPSANPSPHIQRKGAASAGVVQAVKYYPNLHPGATESVDPNSLYKLASFAGQYRLRKANTHGVNVPNLQYNFVRTREGEMLMHNRYRHPSIAEGRHVLYAGEAYFNNGKLDWWSNGSGHYQPDAEDAEQASLPLDQFYTYQQIIKGEHKRKEAPAASSNQR